MLVESASRQQLQAMLRAWLPQIDALHLARGDAPETGRSSVAEATRSSNAQRRVLRWAIDVDPLTI